MPIRTRRPAMGRASVVLLGLFMGTASPLAMHGLAGRQRAALLPKLGVRPARSALPAVVAMADLSGQPVDPAPEAGGSRPSWVPKWVPPADELQKLVPLAMMFFCILFNYTILRDTKDVLVVTAKQSSAEVIPFLKTYVNLPGAAAFVVLYSALANRLKREALFYAILLPFLAFFGAFGWLIYPLQSVLHPHALCDTLAASLPAGFAGPIGVFRNWTFSLFYFLANMWGSVVVSLMFWGFANEITTVAQAKKYYPLFGVFANVALVFSGQFIRYTSTLSTRLPAGVDAWGVALKLLMSAVVLSGGVIAGCYRYLSTTVVAKLDLAEKSQVKKKKKTMSLKESAAYLSSSPYIRNLATLVIAYGMSINLVEVTWKAKLKQAFPNPSEYSAFMGQFSSVTGVVTLCAMFFGRFALNKWGWGPSALITPAVLLATGGAFFGFIMAGDAISPMIATLGTTPLFLAVIFGAAQNVLSKAAKYSLFDPCKEMAYIPLDPEAKTKGKAAIEVVGAPLGKSGGSLIQQVLIFSCGSLAASTPFLAAALVAIITAWIFAARSLSTQFNEKMAAQVAE